MFKLFVTIALILLLWRTGSMQADLRTLQSQSAKIDGLFRIHQGLEGLIDRQAKSH